VGNLKTPHFFKKEINLCVLLNKFGYSVLLLYLCGMEKEFTKNIEMENYIGLILDERNDHYTIGYRQTSNLQKLKEWKKEMLECSNVTDCKILKVEEIN